MCLRYICDNTHSSGSFVLSAVEYSRTCLHLYIHSPKSGHLSCFKRTSTVLVMFYFWSWVESMESWIYWSLFFCLKQSSSSRTPADSAKLRGRAPQFEGRWGFWEWVKYTYMKGLSRAGRLQVSSSSHAVPQRTVPLAALAALGEQRLGHIEARLAGLWQCRNICYLRSRPDLEAPGLGPTSSYRPSTGFRRNLRLEILQGK